MKNHLTLFLLILTLNLQSQTVLKKRDVSELLPQISEYIENYNFEAAIILFYDEERIITIENVNKKQLDEYNSIKNFLSEKKLIYDDNERLVNSYIDEYDNRRFCNSIKMLELELNTRNSYLKSREKWYQYEKRIKQAMVKCSNYSEMFEKFKKDYSFKNYEETFFLIDIVIDGQYFEKSKLDEFNSLIKYVKEIYNHYISLEEDFENQIKVVNEINLFDSSRLCQ